MNVGDLKRAPARTGDRQPSDCGTPRDIPKNLLTLLELLRRT